MTIRKLFPEPAADVDLLVEYEAEHRPPHDDRPWVAVNMVSSVDGASAVDGRAGGLSGPTDQRVLATMRLLADVVLVGAGTVRAEGYAPHRPSPEMRAMREAKGQHPAVAFAVPTSSLDLDPTASLFTGAEPASRTIVFVPSSVAAERWAPFEEVAEVVTMGEATVDLGQVLGALGRRGARLVLCEGGPILNGLLLAEGLIDELCVTISPALVGGPAARIVHGTLTPPSPIAMRLASVLEADDGVLFLRYVRGVEPSTPG